MPVQHKDICESGVNPIQCAYYNKDHKIVNMLGYELVEEKSVPAGSTQIVFTGLNGDEDEEYLLEMDYAFANANPDADIVIKPNNVSTNQASTMFRSYTSGTGNQATSTLAIVSGCFTRAISGYTRVIFKAKTGVKRRYDAVGVYNADDNTGFLKFSGGGYWKNTIDVITSLVITCTNYTFSATARLWKKIPLDGGV